MGQLAISESEYLAEIADLANQLIDSAKAGLDPYDWLHETIDGHPFVIYYTKAYAVLWHSSNDDAYYEQLGENPSGGLRAIMPPLAFFAMQQDVWDELSDRGVCLDALGDGE